MSHESHLIEDSLEAFLLLVSGGAGLKEQRKMKREMVKNRGWKESRNLPDDWIFREMKTRSSMKLWSSDITYISKEGEVLFGINNVKHYMEQSPKYNGFSAFLREDGTTAEDIQIEIRNSVNIAPKGLLKYTSNMDANSEFKVPKVPKSSVSKVKKAVKKEIFSCKKGNAVVQTIVKEMMFSVTSKTTPLNIAKLEDCTECKYWPDKKKLGGPGKLMQKCVLKKDMPTFKRKISSIKDSSFSCENKPAKRRKD